MTSPENTEPAGGARGTPGRPARPRRFDDDARNNAYWARVDAIADAAPPLSTEQKAILRGLFHQPAMREAA